MPEQPETAAEDEPMLEAPEIGLPLIHRGKVRALYRLPELDGVRRLLMVATDRFSAHDVVFPNGIPEKGRILNQLSALWFRATAGITANHLHTTDLSRLESDLLERLDEEKIERLRGRAMVVRAAERVDVEAVVRGYLAGSGWRSYQREGSVCGIDLPQGLELNSRLPEPIFTPALKNDQGHDENVTEAKARHRFGDGVIDAIKEASLKLYDYAGRRALEAGIILADCKFEFGLVDGDLTLIDEVLTPDASRFWPEENYRTGQPIDSLDKQPVRDYLETIDWDMRPPAPELPPEIVRETRDRYRRAYERLSSVLNGGGSGE